VVPPIDQQDADRRKHARFAVSLWAEEVAGQDDEERYLRHCHDLSLGGLFLERKVPFPPGERVRMLLDLQDGIPSLAVSGRVVSVRGMFEAGRPVGNGIEFLELGEPARERIAAAIEQVREE
jgi:Tfp pilus assembly protein PilZ